MTGVWGVRRTKYEVREAGDLGLRPYTFALFSATPTIRHGITTRTPGLWREGDMSFTTGGDPRAVYASRAAWAAAIGVAGADLVVGRLVHGAAVGRVEVADRGRGAGSLDGALPPSDALLTAAPGVPLFMTFADCTPLLFHDPARGVIGLAHAGWRGSVLDIAGATVRAMVAGYGSRARDIRVGIGPAIGRCHYVVGHDVIDAWRALDLAEDDERVRRVASPEAPSGGRDQWRFDLPLANRVLLERAGVRPEQIEDASLCTACHVERFFSHRAEAGRTGRFAAMIALAPRGD